MHYYIHVKRFDMFYIIDIYIFVDFLQIILVNMRLLHAQ